jgi:hypothetical protein
MMTGVGVKHGLFFISVIANTPICRDWPIFDPNACIYFVIHALKIGSQKKLGAKKKVGNKKKITWEMLHSLSICRTQKPKCDVGSQGSKIRIFPDEKSAVAHSASHLEEKVAYMGSC